MEPFEAIENFRQALLSVLPNVQKADIPWKRPDAYDEWDNIATALYKGLVEDVLRWGQSKENQENFMFAQYDMSGQDYSSVRFIEVKHSSLKDGRYAFVALGTEKNPFDIVELQKISSSGKVEAPGLLSCPFAGAQFELSK